MSTLDARGDLMAFLISLSKSYYSLVIRPIDTYSISCGSCDVHLMKIDFNFVSLFIQNLTVLHRLTSQAFCSFLDLLFDRC